MGHGTAQQFDRLPPHSIEAEKCLLASMMLAGENVVIFAECRALVTRESFFQGDHQIIFGALCDMADRNVKIDAVLLREELVRLDRLDEIGDVQYLAAILNSVPSPAHGPYYAGIVREKAILRGVIEVANDALRSVYVASDHDRAADIVQEFVGKLARLTAQATSTEYVTIGDAAVDAFAHLENGEAVLIPTGIKAIDDDLGGLGQGEMLVVGARPSMGKSTLARQIAWRAAELGTPVGYISLEESRAKIARNLLSAIASVENNSLRRGHVQAHEWKELANGVAALSKLPIYIADKAFRMSSLRAVAAMLVAKHGIKILVVDYLQRIRMPGRDRFEQVTNISCELSAMVKELNVAGIVLAQLNREAPKRQDKRPGMTDIRESGQIEQDADQILLLHREDYYRSIGEADGAPDGVAELIKAKYRDGCRGGAIILHSNLKFQRFDEPELSMPFKGG